MAASHDEEQAGFAGSRWPTVVRVLVLLGAPVAVAQRLAGVATARLLDGDVPGDHEAALLAEAVRAWEDDREPWWLTSSGTDDGADQGPDDGPDDEELRATLDLLDRLMPATRARLVLTVVGSLDRDRVDDVVPGGSWPVMLEAPVARAAALVETGQPAVGAARLEARRRRRRRRTTGVVGVLAAAALVIGGTVALVDPSAAPPSGSAAASSPPPTSRPPAIPRPGRLPLRTPTIFVRGDGDTPVPWYDGSTVHLGGTADPQIPVRGLRSMVRVADGVVGVLADSTVVLVGADGVLPIGRARNGSTVVGSPDSPGAAWQDTDGDLVVALPAPDASDEPDVPDAPVVRDLPPGARLLLRDGSDTYVALRSGYLVVSDQDGARRVPGAAPVDVVGGVGGVGGTRLVSGAGGLRVENGSGVVDLPLLGASGALLSDDGRYLLAASITSSSSAVTEVLDARTGDPVRLAVPDDGRVLDASFGDPGQVTLVLSRPDGARFPKRVPRGDLAQPGFDIVTCRLAAGTCESTVQLDAFEVAPLIAH